MDTGGKAGLSDWFDPQTRTLFAAMSATVAAMVALLIWNRPEDGASSGLSQMTLLQACCVGALLLMAQGLRLSAVWGHYADALKAPARNRTASQASRVEHGFIEFFAYLAMALAGLSLLAYASSSGHGPLPLQITGADRNLAHLAGFLIFFAAAFLPLLAGFMKQAHLEAEQRGGPVLRDDVVSEFSFWTTAILVGGLIALAWAAAGGMFQMKEDFGVFITFVVLLVFFVIILAPHLMRLLNNWLERREPAAAIMMFGAPAISPGVMMSRLDSILVRFVAPLSGATQHGPVWFTPHLLVLIVILPLSALGFVLAAPWGLIPIGVAMLIAVALGRRWAWVEEDRETASRLRTTRGREIAIGFDNDLKDEALLGYASLFVLVPLALHQLQGWTESFRFDATVSSNNAFIDWLRFFGAELAKAVPFVDWWEIYNVSIETPYDAATSDNALAKHLTFAARAMVDLVIMAALFQAIGIWQRARTDRRYYKAGQLDAFDPFTEEAFFEHGMWMDNKSGRIVPKKDFRRRVQEHVDARLARNWDGNPYNPERLAELCHADNPDVKAGAEWMISSYSVLVGSPTEQLQRLSLLLQEKQDQLDGTQNDRWLARKYKLEFERVLQELREDKNQFGQADVPGLVGALEAVRTVPEFEYATMQAVHLLRERPSQRATHALFAMLFQNLHRQTDDGLEMWATWQRELGLDGNLFVEKFQNRMPVVEALRDHGSVYFGLQQKALLREIANFMDWVGQDSGAKYGSRGDQSQVVRKQAREVESELRALLRM